MISLNNYIKQINQFFTENKNGNVLKSYDLVFPAKRNDENLNIDLAGNEVFYDDSFDVFLYHRQTNEDINELAGRGRRQLYNIVYTVEMVVFSKDSSFQDFATVILKKVPKLRLISVTNPSQSYDIVNQETGLTDFVFDTTKVFKIVYTLTVMSEECFTIDGIRCHSIGTFPIKVIQGPKGDKGDSGSGGGGLTCEQLTTCPIIENFEERITTLEGEVGGGFLPLAGGTMNPNATVLFTNNIDGSTQLIRSSENIFYKNGFNTSIRPNLSPSADIILFYPNTDGTLVTEEVVNTALSVKQDKEVGKGLSTNDLTDLLKSAYDSAVSWIATNGTNILNHIVSTSNPHQTKCLLFVQHSSTNPIDNDTRFFGNRQVLPQTGESTVRMYFSHSQKITGANIQLFSSTAGSNEAWSLYIRVNDSTDYLIATVSQSANIRLFENNALNISLVAGDFITIKSVQPIWGTNPVGTTGAGNLTIII